MEIIAQRTPLTCAAQLIDYEIIQTPSGEYSVQARSSRAQLCGSVIGNRYLILRQIGEGGSCLAYHALDQQTGNIVCIKEIYPIDIADKTVRCKDNLVPNAGYSFEDLQRQMETYVGAEELVFQNIRYASGQNGITNDGNFLSVAEIEHNPESIARYFCIGTQAGIPLSNVSWNQDWPAQERILDKLCTIKRIAEALKHFHDKQYVHLDLKPANIFVSDLVQNDSEHIGNHHIFLLDYGSSIKIGADGIAENVLISSTVAYAAPEVQEYLLSQEFASNYTLKQLRASISYSSDTYTVVKILQEFLLQGVSEPANGYRIDSIRESDDVNGLPTPIQMELVNFLKKGLSRIPEERFQCADRLIVALNIIIEQVAQKYQLIPKAPICIAKEQFLGREHQLAELDKLLQDNNLVFISGVGGIGKSELAAQYAVRQGNKTVVHMTYTPGWDNEEADPIDRSGLRQLLLNIGISNYPLPPKASNSKKQLFDLPGMMTQPYVSERQAYYNQKLQKLRQLCDDSVLIIIDNFNVANDEGLSDLESLGCKTIVTTWYDYSKTQYAQLTVANTVADKEWALELFYKQCPKASHDEDVVREIIQTLEYHTTAVILLGAQMQSDHADAKALLGSLRNSIKNVGETRVSFSKDGNIRRDATSFGYLCSVFDISVLSPAEKDILIKMSFLPAQEISIEMLRMWSPDVDMNAVNQLIHLRWIEENPRNRNIRLIQIIADVVFETVGHNALDAMDFINHINSWYKELSNREQYQYQHLLELVAQHLMRLVNISSDAQKNATLAKMMSCLANSCHEQSQYKNSVSLYQGAIALYRQSVAINPTAYHANLASCCDMLGIILANGVPKADTSTEVEFLFREALDIRRRLAAEDLNTYGADLAFSCDRLGGFIENTVESSNEAESLYREALDINRQLAKDNPKAYISDLAWSCQNLAFYLARTNRLSAAKSLYHEAELLYRKALDIQRREEIEDPVAHDSALAIGCLNLAILLYEMDHLSESVNLYRETIEIYRRLSVINPTTYESYLASAYKNLAIVLTNTGSFKEAVALARDSLKIRRRQADENPSVGIFELADSYATLANILIRINQTEEAEIYCRETQKLCHLYMKKFSS